MPVKDTRLINVSEIQGLPGTVQNQQVNSFFKSWL